MSGDPYSDSHYSTDVSQLVNNGLVQTDKTVFLASRYEHGLSWGSDGCVRTLTTSGAVDWESLQEYYLAGWKNDSDITLGFRPVVTLRSNLKFTGGSGTAASPYTIALC
ncbi:MAG: hypothetical protein IJB98_03105, partial [Clostridia bacterium]|nr:hypothetical protein [Clostridia bacterium]